MADTPDVAAPDFRTRRKISTPMVLSGIAEAQTGYAKRHSA
jgi:hypothetical protein